MPPSVGQVWLYHNYYPEPDNNQNFLPKFIVILGIHADGDVVCRVLTSKSTGRNEAPSCFHGNPYPGFYIGIPEPKGHLCKPTWLDLREHDDYDQGVFLDLVNRGELTFHINLDDNSLPQILDCAANADDTTKRQANCIKNAR